MNDSAYYTLYAENEQGELKDVRIADLNAWLRGSSNVRGSIDRQSVGTYKIEFVLAVAPGVYHLDVTSNGRPIFKKGDIELEVTGGGGSLKGSTKLGFEMDGAGLYGGRIGTNSEFYITTKDGSGNRADIDVSSLQVVLHGPSTVYATVNEENVGKYLASFVVDDQGAYDIQIFYDGSMVLEQKGSPFSPATDPSRSVVLDAPSQVRARSQVTFTIISRDSHASNVGIGGDPWQALASGPERISNLVIKDNDDGSYTVNTSLPVPGNYSFDIKCYGTPAENSPIKIKVI